MDERTLRVMREAHPTERTVGMDYYVSDSDGTGGRLRARPEDFRVRELEKTGFEPLDADPEAYPHLVFRATLENWDTNDFAGALSDRLGISRERISWAGTKDKRAVSTQLFSVKDGESDALRGVDLGGVDIKLVGRAGRALWFGDLAGNAFEIVVRDADTEPIGTITDDLRAFGGGGDGGENGESAVGVPNYFGHQRFGSLRPVTHEVGLEIIRENWKEAVMAYVGSPHESEPEATREARASAEYEARAETADWTAVLEQYPNRLGFERSMLHRLAENGAESEADYRDALEAVPTNLQRLFVNAAQSHLFNQILSVRLDRKLPFDRAVTGDVVCFADEDSPEGFALPDPNRSQRVGENRVGTVNRHIARGRAFVTAPLVGTDTEFADGEPGDIERTVLAGADISPTDFDLPGEFHSTGTRRAILLRTDLTVERDPLTLDFQLPKGSYATVLLREYLKVNPLELN